MHLSNIYFILLGVFFLVQHSALYNNDGKQRNTKEMNVYLISSFESYPLVYAHIITILSLYQHEVAIEGETGKVYRANFHDLQGRTVLILRPGKQVCNCIISHEVCLQFGGGWKT